MAATAHSALPTKPGNGHNGNSNINNSASVEEARTELDKASLTDTRAARVLEPELVIQALLMVRRVFGVHAGYG